jgi:ankyrin repeat protein
VTLSDDGWNPLHLSTKSDQELFRYFIEELGANPDARNKNGVSVMHKAAFDNNNYSITYLRDKCG